MGKLLVKEKEIVTPGEEIATGMDFLPSVGTFREGENIIANRLGILNVSNRVLKVIALNGNYLPKRGDTIIGKITDVGFSGWSVDIGAPTTANLPIGDAVRERVELLKAEITRYYDVGDIIVAKIGNVTKSRITQLTMREYGLKKLHGGRIIKVATQKVPRIIGKKGSMVSMIKDATKCSLNVGQNGYIWIDGPAENQILAEKAIRLIEEKAHISGLTDTVKELLEKGVKK